MAKKLTPEKVIAFMRVAVALSFNWPLNASATKSKIMFYKLLQLGSFINGIITFYAALNVVVTHTDDLVMVSKVVCIVTGTAHIVLQISLCAMQSRRLQYLIEEVETYCERVQSYEREILQRYIDSYAIFYGGYVIWVYVSAASMAVGITVLSLPVSVEDLHPFLLKHRSYKVLMMFTLQLAAIQTAAQIAGLASFALLLWFAAARFEILAMDFQLITNLYELKKSAREYQELLRFSIDICYTIKYVVMITIAGNAAAMVPCFLVIISNQSTEVKMQFVLMCGTALLEVFILAWPADSLMRVSADLGRSIYNSIWYNQSPIFKGLVLHVISLYQQPVVITCTCFIRALSLEFYSSYVSNAFSIFASLRILVKDNYVHRNETIVNM